MSPIERYRALAVKAMNAGCDEAERLGYGSELGYAEASSISEKAIAPVLEQLMGAVGALVEIANGSRWTAIQTRAHAVAALEAMGVDPYAERKVERPA